MIQSKALAVVVTVAMLLTGSPVPAEAPREGVKRAYRSKPAAPIDVRWVADGSEGRVEIAIASGVDYVGATLRLVVPGARAPLIASLPAASAGEVQTVEWLLDRPVTRSPRLAIELDTGEAVMAKQVLAPPAASGKAPRKGAVPVRPSPDLSAVPSDASPVERHGEELVTLPAEVTIRRAGD